MTLEEILALEEIPKKIELLKQGRKTPLPDRDELLADWDPLKHDVMDKVKRPDEIKVIQEEERDHLGNITKSKLTAPDPVNRIPLPLEQDIVNIHTAFTVGTEPKLNCVPQDEKEKELFSIIKLLDRKNKIKYHNKKLVRAWLSETEVAEYWYTVEDKGFWKRILTNLKKAVGTKTNLERKLKCTLWSPFLGDKLYPFFDETGDYKALSREYQIKVSATQMDTYFMTITNVGVYTWMKTNVADWAIVPERTFAHGFKKNPTIYAARKAPYCQSIRNIRNRLEAILSNYADCIDYNFAPKLVAEGQVIGNKPKGARGGLVEMEQGGKLSYLSWQQTPEAAKLEIDILTERAYSMTNTPRISFENLQGLGNAFSGVSFKYAFMGAHMAVENHAEDIGLFLQRRYNFMVSAVGSVNTEYEEASETIDIEPEIVPYMIGNKAEDIKNAVDASGGEKVASRKTAIVLAGLTEEDKVEEEIKAIEAEESKKAEEPAFPRGSEF